MGQSPCRPRTRSSRNADVFLPCRSFIPDQHLVFCPEQLLRVILAHIHYMPDHWQGNAHRYETRDEFAQLFQYKAVSLAREGLGWKLSPIPGLAGDRGSFLRDPQPQKTGWSWLWGLAAFLTSSTSR